MGSKGAKLSEAATKSADQFVRRVQILGEITSRKMFGGYGVFASGTMFALVSPDGRIFLKADDTNVGRFERAGSRKYGKMPYWELPEKVNRSDHACLEWSLHSIAIT